MYRILLLSLGLLIANATPLAAQVPQVISHQGRIAVNGVNFDGNGHFRFAFVNAAGNLTSWSNDGTSVAGSEPAAAVTLPVSKGHYSVLLGDPSLANMSSLPDSLFDQSDLHLRIWFDDTGGSERLTPDRRIASVPFARRAGSVPAGSITGANLAAGSVGANQLANGAVQSSKIASGAVGASQLAAGAVNITKIANGAVGSNQLANNAVASSKITNGTIQPQDVNTGAFNQTFWRTGGNAGTSAGTHFLGTGDGQPLEFRVLERILRLERSNIIGGSTLNQVGSGRIGATVFGGRNVPNPTDSNVANADLATISGGTANRVDGFASTIAGGENNTAAGNYSFVAGGLSNKADGIHSFAAGRWAEARHSGALVFASGATAPFPSLNSSTVNFFADAGFSIDWGNQTANGRSNTWVFIGPGSDTIQSWTGARLTNGGTWTNSSDVHRKTAFKKVDPAAILDKVASLPIRQWRYKVEAEQVTHLGPTAQDFRAAFALGDDDKSIATVDADGVALAAIQGLHLRLEKTRTENARLKRENAEFRHRLALIEETLAGLASSN